VLPHREGEVPAAQVGGAELQVGGGEYVDPETRGDEE
jgi:hypothetical protein